MDKRPHLVTTEVNKSFPILVIDKKGIVGRSLAQKLKEQFLVVLVSGKELEFHDNIVHIPYKKRIPTVPDNNYSHMFVVYSGESEVLEILPPLIKKANSANSKVFFLTTLAYSSEPLFKRFTNHLYHSMTTVLYGEVFDTAIQSPNMVNLFIHQARNYGRLEIPNEGVGKLYPVFMEDLLVVIIASAFSHETKGKTIFAFPKSPYTEITVARVFKRINPELKIDFNRRKIKNHKYFFPKVGEYAFGNYRLLEGLKKVNIFSSGIENQVLAVAPRPTSERRTNFRLAYLIFVGAILLPILLVIIASLFSIAMLSLSVNQAESGNFQRAAQLARMGKVSLTGAKNISLGYFPADLVASTAKEKAVKRLTSGEQAAGIGTDLFRSLKTFSDIHNGESTDPKKDFLSALATTKNNLLKLQEMKAQNELPGNLAQKLESVSYFLTLFENTADALPKILGFEGEQKYLILFQNNMELRPGGGFIGSYGILDIDQGKVGKLEVHDVYDADGRMKTHIEPPFGLRRYGGVSHGFLRDASFEVDFTNTAAAAARILNLETGEKVQGVIAVDTNFVKNILSAIGPVEVVDYKEKVDAENFYILTQKHAEDNFFPGSTQKKDFLRALLNSMLTQVSENKDIAYFNLLKSAEKSARERHLLFAFSDPQVQRVFTVNNLSGNLLDKRVAEDNTVLDSLSVIDANIGGNKANYYLKRNILQSVIINAGGGIEETAVVTYENTSKKDSVFGGDYKNYVRFVLPRGANLQTVKIDNVVTPTTSAILTTSIFTSKSFVPPPELEIEATKVGEKEVVAFFMIVPVGAKKDVAITYTIPQSVNTNSPVFGYDLRLFKQPGTDEDPFTFSLAYPGKYGPIQLGEGILDLGGKVKFETKLNEDKNIKIKFSQK